LAFATLFVRLIIPIQCSLDALEQGVLVQQFLDKVKGSCAHRRNRQRYRAMAGDRDYRHAPATDIELLLQFEPGHPGYSHVEQ